MIISSEILYIFFSSYTLNSLHFRLHGMTSTVTFSRSCANKMPQWFWHRTAFILSFSSGILILRLCDATVDQAYIQVCISSLPNLVSPTLQSCSTLPHKILPSFPWSHTGVSTAILWNSSVYQEIEDDDYLLLSQRWMLDRALAMTKKKDDQNLEIGLFPESDMNVTRPDEQQIATVVADMANRECRIGRYSTGKNRRLTPL